jgi:hypothetical protein
VIRNTHSNRLTHKSVCRCCSWRGREGPSSATYRPMRMSRSQCGEHPVPSEGAPAAVVLVLSELVFLLLAIFLLPLPSSLAPLAIGRYVSCTFHALWLRDPYKVASLLQLFSPRLAQDAGNFRIADSRVFCFDCSTTILRKEEECSGVHPVTAPQKHLKERTKNNE